MGAAALLIAVRLPGRSLAVASPARPCRRQAEEAGIPVVFNFFGGTGELIDPNYFHNGLPIHPTSTAARRTSARSTTWRSRSPTDANVRDMIFDGVLDRYPALRIGVIEQGCIWLPSWLKQMESAMDAFGRHEERLQQLSMRPGEFVERQVRVTPYPTEDIGWVTDQIGPNCCCSTPTTRTSKAVVDLSNVSRRASETDPRNSGGSTPTTSST